MANVTWIPLTTLTSERIGVQETSARVGSNALMLEDKLMLMKFVYCLFIFHS